MNNINFRGHAVRRENRGHAPFAVILVALCVFGTAVGAMLTRSAPIGASGISLADMTGSARPVQSRPAQLQTPQLCGAEENVIQVAKTVGPSVVAIYNMQSPGGGRAPERAGLGSGFIVRSDGLIATNAHVVQDSDRVDVGLLNGKQYTNAKILGVDPRIDVALVKINVTGLPVVTMGDSDALQVGQQAIAIGNPLGFEHTVTVGVVSALNRVIPGGGTSLRDLVQTDASIGPGNSGGPLIDSCGRVIGVNAAIVTTDSGLGNLGFAVPINTVKHAVQSLSTAGKIAVPWLGIGYTEIDDQTASSFDLPVKSGLLVGSVAPDSPAAKAGLKKGDIIIEMNGKSLTDSGRLQEFIRDANVGTQLTLTWLRNGQRMSKTITLEEMPNSVAMKEQ
jgi:serine protease Do